MLLIFKKIFRIFIIIYHIFNCLLLTHVQVVLCHLCLETKALTYLYKLFRLNFDSNSTLAASTIIVRQSHCRGSYWNGVVVGVGVTVALIWEFPCRTLIFSFEGVAVVDRADKWHLPVPRESCPRTE